MASTLYDATIVDAKIILDTLDSLLKKAEEQPTAESFLKARLHEDMNPLTFQVHAATRFTELVLARLSGREAVQYEDNLASYADMHARISEVQKALEEADKDTVNRYGEEVLPTALPSAGTMDISGRAFAKGAAIPNIYFHLNMTYAILRKEGVPLGKKDYAMGFAMEHILKPQ